MIHNFSKSLKHEREQTDLADQFYRNVLEVSEIKRFNSDSEVDMTMQKQDVDVLLTLKGTNFRVSEKFRDKDYGDLYIEIFSKYPHVNGWIQTGSPHAILYFTPLNIYWITHKSLKKFCIDKLFPEIKSGWFLDIYNSGKTFERKRITIDNNGFNINIIQAHNSDGNNWETLGVSIPFEILENFGVKLKRFETSSNFKH